MSARLTHGLLAVSPALYRLLLVAYPRGFRHAYGPAMVQVFRDCCRSAARRGLAGLAGVWTVALPDLLASGWRERLAPAAAAPLLTEETTMEKQSPRLRAALYALAALFGLAVAYLNLHTDETPFVAIPLLAACALLGALGPRGAWRWGLLVGLWLPLSQAWAYWIGMRLPYPNTAVDVLSAAIPGLLIGLVGAYLGALAGWVLRRAAGTQIPSGS